MAAALFGLGVYGVLTRRNAVLLLMSVELMLNAVNLVLVTADATIAATLPASGQVFALFVIVLAAAEVGVGLALVLVLYRLRASVAVDEIPLSDPEPAEVTPGEVTPGEVTPGEVTPGEVTPGEVAPGEVAPARAGSAEVGT
jgi:NADH-quinone oxidoreductase subunit K